ncbi:cell division protein FtsB [Lysobacter soyae]|jgi:cell division protein FtsB|uniref:Cell division protein FtsB n=1 Tax=Lysobacter soyae TaxID=2764185 RepID=A0ABX8WL68_9GAMM|nr:cell division protein FtsB [Lysobacter sp. CJ11]QYR52365.1 cell division protein FtsB [Lysobacter sp. CJ11]
MKPVRIACLLLVLLFILLQYRWWMGTGGRRDVADLKAKVEAQQKDNEARKQRNDALAAEVKDLTDPASGGAAVEERARDELGMIKPGETFYRVINDKPSPSADADKSAQAGTADSAP